jgi:hypothetical protein
MKNVESEKRHATKHSSFELLPESKQHWVLKFDYLLELISATTQ